MSRVATHKIATNISYAHHPAHRDNTPDKSQWIITEYEERKCFVDARAQKWLARKIGWGLYIATGCVAYLGTARDRQRQLFVAKFVNPTQQNLWHGYPADHQRTTNDIPTNPILKNWLNSKLLSAAKVRKLSRGQPCVL